MKKKIIPAILCAAIAGSLIAGCSSSGQEEKDSAGSSATTAAASETEENQSITSSASETETTSSTSGNDFVINMNDMLAGTQFEGLKANDSYEFNFIVKAFQNTYYQAVVNGAQDAAEEFGVKINPQGPNNESDIADQVNMLNSAINGKPDGIGLAASDNTAVLDSLETAKEEEVPLISFDSTIDGAPEGSVTATIATDSKQAGSVGGAEMWKAIKDRVNKEDGQVIVGVVAQDSISTNHQNRGLGFIDGLIDAANEDGVETAVTGNDYFTGKCKDKGDAGSAKLLIEVAVPAQSTLDLASTEASAIMNKSNCVGIFGTGQTAAEGIIQANDNLDILGTDPMKNCIMIGFDSGAILKEKIEDDTMYGAITQTPYAIGYYAVCALVKAANGDEVEDMPMPGYFYNKENINDDLIAPNLYD